MKILTQDRRPQTGPDRHSHFLDPVTLGLAGSVAGSLIPEGACFGDKACQKNREAQLALAQTQAQTQYLNAQNQGKTNWVLILVVVGVFVIAGGGLVFLLKNKNN
jgi:hypothetical protein